MTTRTAGSVSPSRVSRGAVALTAAQYLALVGDEKRRVSVDCGPNVARPGWMPHDGRTQNLTGAVGAVILPITEPPSQSRAQSAALGYDSSSFELDQLIFRKYWIGSAHDSAKERNQFNSWLRWLSLEWTRINSWLKRKWFDSESAHDLTPNCTHIRN